MLWASLGRALRYPHGFPRSLGQLSAPRPTRRSGRNSLRLHGLRKSALVGGARLDCCAFSRRATFVMQCPSGAALTAPQPRLHLRVSYPTTTFPMRAKKMHHDVGMGRSSLCKIIEPTVTIGLHSYADTSDCIVSFLTPPHRSPCTIRYDLVVLTYVRYDLESRLCTIQSLSSFLYDINLGATTTTIPRIRGAQIPIDLVSSATDSYRRSVVLFKPMSVPTSDPKSEFLYQSSSTVRSLQTSP